MAEKKVYLGVQYGTFKDEKTGRTVRYSHLFVMEPFPESDNPEYNAFGYRANKYKLKDPKEVINQGLKPLDAIQVFYDARGAVTEVAQIGRLECSKDGDNLEDMLGE